MEDSTVHINVYNFAVTNRFELNSFSTFCVVYIFAIMHLRLLAFKVERNETFCDWKKWVIQILFHHLPTDIQPFHLESLRFEFLESIYNFFDYITYHL